MAIVLRNVLIPVAVGLGLALLVVTTPLLVRHSDDPLVRWGFWLFPGIVGLVWAGINHHRSMEQGAVSLVLALLGFTAICYGLWMAGFGLLWVALFIVTSPLLTGGGIPVTAFLQEFYLWWWAALTLFTLLLVIGPTADAGRWMAGRLFGVGTAGRAVETWIASTMPWSVVPAALFRKTRAFARRNWLVALFVCLAAGVSGWRSAEGEDLVAFGVLSMVFGPLALLVVGPLLAAFQFVAAKDTHRTWVVVYLEVMAALPFLVMGYAWAMENPAS